MVFSSCALDMDNEYGRWVYCTEGPITTLALESDACVHPFAEFSFMVLLYICSFMWQLLKATYLNEL
jgi:hypothetical protein